MTGSEAGMTLDKLGWLTAFDGSPRSIGGLLFARLAASFAWQG
jgi:hypothetical protein